MRTSRNRPTSKKPPAVVLNAEGPAPGRVQRARNAPARPRRSGGGGPTNPVAPARSRRGAARRRRVPARPGPDLVTVSATEEDWDAEYLALILAVRVVDGLDAALDHIAEHGSGHTEVILSRDEHDIERFLASCDSSSVMVNASTRFADGGEYGLGAEIGISTDKIPRPRPDGRGRPVHLQVDRPRPRACARMSDMIHPLVVDQSHRRNRKRNPSSSTTRASYSPSSATTRPATRSWRRG